MQCRKCGTFGKHKVEIKRTVRLFGIHYINEHSLTIGGFFYWFLMIANNSELYVLEVIRLRAQSKLYQALQTSTFLDK